MPQIKIESWGYEAGSPNNKYPAKSYQAEVREDVTGAVIEQGLVRDDYEDAKEDARELRSKYMGDKQWGGRRSGAGLPYRKRLNLDEETARTLRTLLLHRRDLLNKSDMTEEDVVKSLVDAAWYELDQHFQEASEQGD